MLLSDILCRGDNEQPQARFQYFRQSQFGRWRIAEPCLLNNFSGAAHDLLSSLLDSDSSRPTAEEALRHPWFHAEGQKNDESERKT